MTDSSPGTCFCVCGAGFVALLGLVGGGRCICVASGSRILFYLPKHTSPRPSNQLKSQAVFIGHSMLPATRWIGELGN